MLLIFSKKAKSRMSNNSFFTLKFLSIVLCLPRSEQSEADSLLKQLVDLSPQSDSLLLGLLVPADDLCYPPPLSNAGGDGPPLDPPEEVSLPQLERHRGHAGPDHTLKTGHCGLMQGSAAHIYSLLYLRLSIIKYKMNSA